MNKTFLRYLTLFFAIIVTWVLAQFAPLFFSFFTHGSESSLLFIFFILSILCVLSFVVFHTSDKTIIPSFVAAIFFGMAAHKLLTPVTEHNHILSVIVGFGATLILFSGGLETPFSDFKKLIWKILSLSFIGLLVTASLFSILIFYISQLLHIPLSIPVVVLLGSVLASTDPAAIIPALRVLRFNNRSNKDIVISESAVTDVTGTLLTIIFLEIIVNSGTITSIAAGYTELFSTHTLIVLSQQIGFGGVFGVIGYGLLLLLDRLKEKHDEEFDVDAAYFLFVPIVIFTLAVAFGGSGYLAAFLAGLLYVLARHLHDTERFFNHTIDGFLKPFIFILLGALVNIHDLLAFAKIGILIALVFMLVIRPIAVFISLGGFTFFGKEKLCSRDLLFISFVRETGAIPAVLLVTIVSLGIPGLEGLLPIGMWVILLTLLIGPALTPWVAKKLQVADMIKDEHKLVLDHSHPSVILASRGHSFGRRLPIVADWALRHNIRNVTLLHCPEDTYSTQLVEAIKTRANDIFDRINTELKIQNVKPIQFSIVNRRGFLQDNIDEISQSNNSITAIFVGRKMLDFHPNEIKHMKVPLFFID